MRTYNRMNYFRASNNRLLSATLMLPIAGHAFSATPEVTSDNNKANPKQPNVILLVGDDIGYGDLQCYGAKNVKTPNVDRLAEAGVRFTNAHCVAATSTPSRYSLLTGEYAWRKEDTNIADGDAAMIIKPSQFTLADMFRSVGYSTAAIGKWHLGLGDTNGGQDWNASLAESPADIGFDYHYIMAATADRVPCAFIENGKVANYDASAPISVNYKANFPGEPTGKDNPELLYNQKPTYGHDMSIVNGISRIGFMKGGGNALWKDENIADSITSHALGFIRNNSQHPFFLYLATNDIHVPRCPHPRFRGKSGMGLRGDAILEFDWTVGQVMQTLKELGIADNTIIILTSDNGPVVDDGYADQAQELLNGHKPAGGLRGSKYSSFEGGTMVPFIVNWPGQAKKGLQSNALFSHIDIMGSLANLVGARMPQGSAPDSENRIDCLLGQSIVDRPWVIEMSNTRVLSVRTPQWKYIEPSDGPESLSWCPEVETGNKPVPQLFDITSQKWEENNIAEKNPSVVFELQNVLRRAKAKF